jgi:hypothetical protein
MRSAAPLMARIGAAIGPQGALALVQWKEQFVLHADRPVTHFGYFREDAEGEAREAAAWVAAAADRFVLLPRESLAPAFAADRCVDLGQRHRRYWYLCSAPSLVAAQSDDAPQAPGGGVKP